jgi:hypothetical protein
MSPDYIMFCTLSLMKFLNNIDFLLDNSRINSILVYLENYCRLMDILIESEMTVHQFFRVLESSNDVGLCLLDIQLHPETLAVNFVYLHEMAFFHNVTVEKLLWVFSRAPEIEMIIEGLDDFFITPIKDKLFIKHAFIFSEVDREFLLKGNCLYYQVEWDNLIKALSQIRATTPDILQSMMVDADLFLQGYFNVQLLLAKTNITLDQFLSLKPVWHVLPLLEFYDKDSFTLTEFYRSTHFLLVISSIYNIDEKDILYLAANFDTLMRGIKDMDNSHHGLLWFKDKFSQDLLKESTFMEYMHRHK